MQISELYCPHCGAANDETASLCFACSSSLAPSTETPEDIILLNQRYRVLTSIGTGGFGIIYKAEDTKHPYTLFAIKQINLDNLSTQQVIDTTEAFHREVQLLSSLQHANLPRIYDSFTDPHHWYMVMDFIEGETLEQYLHLKKAMLQSAATPLIPVNEIVTIGIQLCAVLEYLHAQQPPIIFRDLKPSNIMRTAHGHLFLIDFGIARQFKPGKAKDTLPLGSPGYAAPEQYGKAQTTPRADIYSFGVLLHQIISGDDPSEHSFQFTPLQTHNSNELVELNALIQRMLQMQSSQRPDIHEVKAVFQRLQSSLHLQPPIQPGKVFPLPQTTGTKQNANQLYIPGQQGAGVIATPPLSRRRFVLRASIGAIGIFSAGWFASSRLTLILAQPAQAVTMPTPTDATVNLHIIVQWTFRTSNYVMATPAIANGIVYASSEDGNLYALDATLGHQKWAVQTHDRSTSPTVANGIVYTGLYGNLYALDATSGQQKWVILIANHFSGASPIEANGVVYIGSDDGNLYALDATSGHQKWIFQTSGSLVISPVVIVNGVVYVGSNDEKLYALDATSGHQKWAFQAQSIVSNTPTVANGIVYFSSNDGNLYALDVISGHQKWIFQTNGIGGSSPTVANGIVYIGSTDKNLYALDATSGQVQWSFLTGDAVNSSPMVANGIVYFGSNDKNLYALDATSGQVQWSFLTGDAVNSSPTLANGIIYFGSNDGNIYALILPQ